MKNYLQRIIKASGIFILLYVMQAVLFSIIFSRYSSLSFANILIYELAAMKKYQIEMNMLIAGISAVQNILYAVIVAIFATYVYTCLVYKIPKVLTPPKLVIRRRSNGKLCFGVLIGNKNRNVLNDTECTLTFRYQKADGGMNNEFKLKDTHTNLINFYRFSFDISDVPAELMEAYISKESTKMQNDEILVTFSGTGYANNKFYVKKAYKLSDIIIDKYNPENAWVKIVNPFTNKIIKKKLSWKLLYKEEEVGELERNDIINEICQIFDFPT